MALGMTARHDTISNEQRVSSAVASPFPRFDSKRGEGGWEAVDLGGHEVISRLHLQLRPSPQAAGEGRHSLDRLEGAIDGSDLDILKLLITELITNSVRHGDHESWIQLDIEIYSNAVRVQVVDQGTGFQPKESPEPHADRLGGWGLTLVDRLADRWGVVPEGATRVWFELNRSRRGVAAV